MLSMENLHLTRKTFKPNVETFVQVNQIIMLREASKYYDAL